MEHSKVQTMLAKKKWLIVSSFSLTVGIMGGILLAAVMSAVDLLNGGVDAVVQGWRNNGADSDAWKWAGGASIPFDIWAGVFIWRSFMLRTGLLTKEEMDELMNEVMRPSKK